MSVQIIANDKHAVFYCTTTDWAFGPVMHSEEEAETFLAWLTEDPRSLTQVELEDAYNGFVQGNVCECGELRPTECIECKYDGEPDDNGVHVLDGEPSRCDKDPLPSNGERYKCRDCNKQDRAAVMAARSRA